MTLLGWALDLTAPARAAGYWNVPSSFCQCMGCGWGAGYHAPLVLGPGSHRTWCATNEVRLPYSPVPHYGCMMHNGCSGFCQPTQLEVPPVPPSSTATPFPTEAVTAPITTPQRALFASPIER